MTTAHLNTRNRARLAMMPPIVRTPMAAKDWADYDRNAGTPAPWHASASLRRMCLTALVCGQTWLAGNYMASVLPYHGRQPLEIALLVLFAILFAWISAGFWTAMAGFAVLLKGGDRRAISRTAAGDAPIAANARTAIVMPIHNEDVRRVFAGLRVTYESLARTKHLQRFDFFVLSDSTDPAACEAEPRAWRELCTQLNAFGRFFYRRRIHRIKRKSGNVADFCRRWGKNYRYMVVLDADSVMTGECLTRLVQMMEANPGAGIIQTAPHATGRETLYARVQQFAGRVYGPLFATGLHFWQLGDSHYWGHNAIIRVKPFIEHCALTRLPGSGVLSGEVLSHDFVEAALIRRAGYSVWLAYDIPGSYEEMPPNLIDELARDRRWCQGNLMNAQLFTLKGIQPAHRMVFLTGVMAYVSSPLWFLFLILSTVQLAIHALTVPQYFVMPFQLFPLWPEWRPERAILLFCTTALLLFLPKIAAVLLACRDDVRRFGGMRGLVVSTSTEMILSSLLAPVRMLFHTEFVAAALAGIKLRWQSPPREDAQTGWAYACRRHGWQTLLGIAWAAGVYHLNPQYLWLLLPIAGAMALAIPLSVLSSRVSLGRSAARSNLFIIPEEADAPPEIRRLRQLMNGRAETQPLAPPSAFYPPTVPQKA